MILLGGLMGAVTQRHGRGHAHSDPSGGQTGCCQSRPWMRALMMGVIVGTNGVVLSPFSTVGALACGCAPEGVDVNRLYKNLLLTAILFSVSAFVVSYLGIYTKTFPVIYIVGN